MIPLFPIFDGSFGRLCHCGSRTLRQYKMQSYLLHHLIRKAVVDLSHLCLLSAEAFVNSYAVS